MTNREFELQFALGELPPELFTHGAHLRLAWIHITQYGIEAALENVTQQIKRYTRKHNASDKYNHTLTMAAVKAVYHFVLKSESDTFQDFLKEFPRLKHNFRDLMACHYGFDIYTSVEAKKSFLEPDLLPFD